MNLRFQDDQSQSVFFRDLRLVHDDLVSYASSAAPYCAFNDEAENEALVEELNRDALFWNCVLASLQTTAFVSLGRLHDKAKQHNHLGRYIKAMQSQDKECVKACEQLQRAIAKQQTFLQRVVTLRHKVFVHTDFHAPLFAAFGFEGLTINDFRVYWDDTVSALEACDLAMFGTQEHGPKFEKSLFASIETATKTALLRRVHSK